MTYKKCVLFPFVYSVSIPATSVARHSFNLLFSCYVRSSVEAGIFGKCNRSLSHSQNYLAQKVIPSWNRDNFEDHDHIFPSLAFADYTIIVITIIWHPLCREGSSVPCQCPGPCQVF
jgi:hypothetical protein